MSTKVIDFHTEKKSMTSNVTMDLVSKLFEKFKMHYGSSWKASFDSVEDVPRTMKYWYDQLAQFTREVLIKAVKHALIEHTEFPPKIGQIVDLCWHYEGIPCLTEVLQDCIRRELKHPITFEVYKAIGSWALRNASERDLNTIALPKYHSAVASFKTNPGALWDVFNSRAIEHQAEEVLPKQITSDEKHTLREILSKSKVEAAEVKNSGAALRVWDRFQIMRGHKDFNKAAYDERSKYLLALSEKEASTLDPYDWFDRSRYRAEDNATEHLRKVGYTVDRPTKEERDYDSRRSHSGYRNASQY